MTVSTEKQSLFSLRSQMKKSVWSSCSDTTSMSDHSEDHPPRKHKGCPHAKYTTGRRDPLLWRTTPVESARGASHESSDSERTQSLEGYSHESKHNHQPTVWSRISTQATESESSERTLKRKRSGPRLVSVWSQDQKLVDGSSEHVNSQNPASISLRIGSKDSLQRPLAEESTRLRPYGDHSVSDASNGSHNENTSHFSPPKEPFDYDNVGVGHLLTRGSAFVEGEIFTLKSVYVNQDLHVDQNTHLQKTTVNDDLIVCGNATIGKSLVVHESAFVDDSLVVKRSAFVDQSLEVAKTIYTCDLVVNGSTRMCGGLYLNIVKVSCHSYTVRLDDHTILLNGTTEVCLPLPCSETAGHVVMIKNLSPDRTANLLGPLFHFGLRSLGPFSGVILQSDGLNWHVLSSTLVMY